MTKHASAEVDITVDHVFAGYIFPLSGEELELLEQNIVEHGGARDPLVVWASKGTLTLLDGHNRYEICTRLELPFDIEEMRFDSRDEAADWMDRNQLGRRNLHPDAFTLLLGRRYNRAKNSHGGDRKSSDQSDHLKNTAAKIAKEHGVGEATVRRAGKLQAAAAMTNTDGTLPAATL